MVSQLFKKNQVEEQVEPPDSDSDSKGKQVKDDVEDNIDHKEENQTLDLNKISVLKTNAVRFMPEKIRCRSWLKKEERLFLDALPKYHESINLVKFIQKFEKLQEDMKAIQDSLKPRQADVGGLNTKRDKLDPGGSQET